MLKIWIWFSPLFVITVLAMVAWPQTTDPTRMREEAQRLQSQGNWKEAYERYEQLVVMQPATGTSIETDLRSAVLCLSNLGLLEKIDKLLDSAVQVHSNRWQVLAEAARLLQEAPHHGMVADQKFTRNPTIVRSGQHINTMDQDRHQALRWLEQALQLAGQQAAPAEKAGLYLQTARALLLHRSGREAWRLQSKTDLALRPDYLDFEAPSSWPARYAPVTEDGQPVLYSVPQSWEAAKNDGERLRWCLAQETEMAGASGGESLLIWADFLHAQFSVDTLQEDVWLLRAAAQASDERKSGDSTGVFAIHTLAENETIARLASGVKRFELADEFNPIRVFQKLAADSQRARAETALMRLAHTFMNRRQYPKAAEYLRQSIARYGDDNRRSKQNQLDNIVKPRASFDPVPTQPAGRGAKLSLLFRNAKQAHFSARPVEVEKLLTDIKQFYRDLERNNSAAFGGRPNQGPPQIQSPGELFGNVDLDRYVQAEVASWTLELQPRENHWDRRIEVAAPLQKAGLYVVTASLDDAAHTARCIVWIQDTALVRQPLSSGSLYFAADANSGQPLANMNVEFFGFGNRPNPTGRGRNFLTKNLAKKTDRQGQVMLVAADDPDRNMQWLVMARGSGGRLGILGLDHSWFAAYERQNMQQTKAYGVSDRPVYRPGDTIQAKFWLAKASYGEELAAQSMAAATCEIKLFDPQGKEFWTHSAKTDTHGGVDFEISLPKTATLGVYRFQVMASGGEVLATELTVRVEEYRKPEFEVKISSPDKPVALGEKFEAKIEAKYYFGSPVTEATVNVKVTRTAYTDNYYPVAPYDWCYGPGYGWLGYDYPWYPGWGRWRGCIMPEPRWWPRWGFEPPELVLEQELKLDANGLATISIDTALARAIYGDQDHKYSVSVEVRDASRRTITATGEVIAAREAFKIYSWLNRGFYRTGEAITASFHARTLDGKPVEAAGKLDLLRISYDQEQTPTESLVQSWEVKTDKDGRLDHRLVAQRAGQYRLRLTLSDEAGKAIEGAYLFTVRGASVSGKDFRFTSLELIPDQQHYAPGEKVQLQINADRDDALVMLFIRPVGGAYLAPQFVQLQSKSRIVEIPVTPADQPNFFVEAVTVYDGEVHQAVREVIVPPAKRVLDVAMTTDKSEYRPGEEAEVTLNVTDPEGKPVAGSTVLAVYDRSLEQIAPDTIPGDIRAFFWKWRREHQPNRVENLSWETYPVTINGIPMLMPIGIFGQSLADDLDALGSSVGKLGRFNRNSLQFRGLAREEAIMGMGGMMAEGRMLPKAMSATKYDMAGSAMALATESSGTGGTAPGTAQASATVRKVFADAALWLAKIETNSEGKATARFKMPENLTSWKLRSWVVGAGVRVGSGASEAVTRKNLLVRLQTPRFLVERDEVVLSAIVHNDLPDAKEVTVSLEIDGQTQLEAMPGVQLEQKVRIASHEQARIDWRCRALAEGNVTLRAIALTDVESDAMQLKTPIIVNGILKTDSFAGTVRADQAKSVVSVRIPEQRRVEHSRLTVRLSPSLAAAMIDALPYMADYPYGCTEQTLNRFLPTVITQKILQTMQIDLARLKEKRSNLNAQELGQPTARAEQWKRFNRNPVYDVEEVKSMVDDGIRRLTDMQNSDGGWGWFSGPQEHSWPHTTAVVVRGLLIAQQNDVAIVPDVLARAIAWLEQYQQGELQKLKNGASETEPYKKQPDNLDALVFNVLNLADRHSVEMQSFLYEQRAALSVYGKTLVALAIHKIGNAEQTAMLRRNIEQFLVQDAENETAYLRDQSSWWYWHGSQIEASAMYLKLLSAVEPKGQIAQRVVKYLLNNRKHATYWASTRDTALVVEAFGDYLKSSGETKSNVNAEVWLGGKRLGSVQFTPENMFEVDNTIEIAGNAVPAGQHQLEVRRAGEGPLYWNAYATNFTLEEEITAAGLEVKVERRYYRLDPTKKDLTLAGDRGQTVDTARAGFDRISLADLQALPSGTLVEIELLVESKNDYEYLILEDRKPAGLEPVDTQSGYLYSQGVSMYRELRDQRVSFFVQWLPRGQHSLRYRLRAEAPGRFTALPATISGMYAPELVGNSADYDLQVTD